MKRYLLKNRAATSEVITWITNNIGEQYTSDNKPVWHLYCCGFGYKEIEFEQEEDSVLFALHWLGNGVEISHLRPGEIIH